MMIDSLLLLIGILVLICFSPYLSSHEEKEMVRSESISLKRKMMNIEVKSEYGLILMFSILGASIMISANDMISIYVALELQSFGLYILACLRTDQTGSTHASLKYFLLGAISSAFILLGISIIYQEVGSTVFQNIHSFILVNFSDQSQSFFILDQGHRMLALGLLSILCGFIFKISAAPFHSWFSDVIQGVPTATSIIIINLPKISIFTFLFNMLMVCGVITSQTEDITDLQSNFISQAGETFLIFTTLFSLVLGTVAGLKQTKIKRLLAFSTISHVGFILISLSTGSEVSLNAIIFYLVQYTLTVVLTFLALIAYENSLASRDLKENAGQVNYILELQGTGQYYKLLTITFVLCLFSIAGIPPLTGFYAKLGVLNSSILQNINLVFLTAIICSVISAAYYLKVIKVIMFDTTVQSHFQKVSLSPLHSYTMAVITAFICLFILDSQLILNCTELVALSLYIT